MKQFIFESMCDDIEDQYRIEQLRQVAAEIGVDIRNKTKRQLCKAMAIWARDMKYQYNLQRTECSVADVNAMGDEIANVPPYFIYTIATNLTFQRNGKYVQNATVCSDIRDLIEWIGENNLPNEPDPAEKELKDLVARDRHPQYSGIILSLELKRNIRARWTFLKSVLTPEILTHNDGPTTTIKAYERPSWIQPLETILQAMPYVRYNASQMGLLPDWKLIAILKTAAEYEVTDIQELDITNFETQPTIEQFVMLIKAKLEACIEANKSAFIIALNQAIDHGFSRIPDDETYRSEDSPDREYDESEIILLQRIDDFFNRRFSGDRLTETMLTELNHLFTLTGEFPYNVPYLFYRLSNDPIMSIDQNAMLIAMTRAPWLIRNASNETRDNETIMNICIAKDRTLFEYASLRLRHNLNFVKKCHSNGVSWERYSDMIRQDNALGRILMTIDSNLINYVSDRLRNDDLFIIHLIKTGTYNSDSLFYRLNERQRNDFELAAVSVISGSLFNLRIVSERLRNNKTFMNLVIQSEIRLFHRSEQRVIVIMENIGSSLKDDGDFMSSLFSGFDVITVYKYASKRLRNSISFNLEALQANRLVWDEIDSTIQNAPRFRFKILINPELRSLIS